MSSKRDRVSLQLLTDTLARLAPLGLAESWDNVGLLVGSRYGHIERAMTCLTVTAAVVAEAIERDAQLIISHHPLPFKPLTKITSDTITGQLLLDLISNNVAIYSAHTAMDSAAEGINQHIAERLQLESIQPLSVIDANAQPKLAAMGLGSGRFGTNPRSHSLTLFADEIGSCLNANCIRVVGLPQTATQRVAIACGSGGSFLNTAHRLGCDTLVTGEATFHTCLEAEALGISLVLTGHYASERFAMEWLADRLSEDFPHLEIWPSQNEKDPIWTAFSRGG